MKVQTIHDQGTGIVNEDVLLVTKDTFGVFDGATSLNAYINESGKTGGLLAAEIAKTIFEQGNKPLPRLAKEANKNIQTAMKIAGVDASDGVNRWRSAAAVIQLGERVFNWIVIADCVVLIIRDDASFEPVTPFRRHDTKVMKQWKELAKKKEHNIRAKLVEDIADLRKKSRPVYGVLNGEAHMEQYFATGEYDLSGITHILLFTDGFLMPSEDPAEPEDFSKIVSLFLEGGLKKVVNTVRKLESADPNCWKYPRYKQYDDIAGISISL